MLPPNILVTNYCNQNCPFCFARKEMGKKNKGKDIGEADYKTIIAKIRRSGGSMSLVRLLGGEPTIHARFKDIIRLSLEHFQTVQIFTNGMFSEDTAEFLNAYGTRIRYVFNVVTPGFTLQKKIRETVLSRIHGLPAGVHSALSLTLDPFTEADAYLTHIPDTIFERVSVIRLGLSNPMKGDRNPYDMKDFSRIGTLIAAVKKRVLAKNSAITFAYGCGLTRCMFTDAQYEYVTRDNPDAVRFGCNGKKSSMDIATDLHAFHCFPLSVEKNINIRNKTLARVRSALLMQRRLHWQKSQPDMCRQCPFFGIGEGSCPGPCIAFRFNRS